MMIISDARTIENPLIGDQVRLLESCAESQGKHTWVEVLLSPKGGNGMHYHSTFSETFEVLEGTLGVDVEKEKLLLQTGERQTVMPGELHRFYNPSDTEPVRFTVKLNPGHTGFEHTLQVVYGLSRDGKVNRQGIPRNFYHLALIFIWGDTNIPGLLSYLTPVLRWAARRATKKGIAKSLIDQYCHW